MPIPETTAPLPDSYYTNQMLVLMGLTDMKAVPGQLAGPTVFAAVPVLLARLETIESTVLRQQRSLDLLASGMARLDGVHP